jgi:hypothetical protein
MAPSVLDYALWAATILANVALLAVLLVRRRCREFPVFTVFIAFQVVVSVALYIVLRYGHPHWYSRCYWTSIYLEFLLELAVVWEVVRIVMRPTGTWAGGAKRMFLLGSAIGVIFAAGLAWLLSPRALSFFDRLNVQIGFFATLVLCELFIVMILTSRWHGYGFRNHVFALLTGWTGLVVVAMIVDLFEGYSSNTAYFGVADKVRIAASLLATAFMGFQFWREEPKRRDIPPEVLEYVQSLRGQIKRDIDKIVVT